MKDKSQEKRVRKEGNTPQEKSEITLSEILVSIDTNFDENTVKENIGLFLEHLVDKYSLSDYTILYLIDAEDSLSSWHSNRIYRAASLAEKAKDVLLILHSHGGSIEAGYFIGKVGKNLSKNKFSVAIPRKAKSAATLLSLGADEIHMGLLSELGPIDPQINGFPAQGIKNSLEILTDMSCRHPGSAEMLGNYLSRKLDLKVLGLFERINESAIQYAERLIAKKQLPNGHSARSLSDHLVNHYKDHGFVIDYDEANALLGDQIVKKDTNEYRFANEVFESFDLIKFLLSMKSKDIDIVGSCFESRIFNKED